MSLLEYGKLEIIPLYTNLLPTIDVSLDRDTVNSVGIFPHRLPFTTSNTALKTFRHAVSLDERRAKFKANLYNRPTKKELALGTKPGEMPKSGPEIGVANLDGIQPVDPHAGHWHAKEGSGKKGKNGTSDKKKQRQMEREFSISEATYQHTNVKEVWFAGCHAGRFLSLFILRQILITINLICRCRWWLCRQ